MKKTMFVFSVLLLTAFVSQAQVQYVGIPSVTFTPAAQQQDEWCWAASIQMILNYYHIPISQQMVVDRVKGGPIDQGGSDGDISTSLNGWAPGIDGSVKAVSSTTSAGPPPYLMLLQELSNQHPILLTFATGPNGGHAVVITGASYLRTPMGPTVNSIIIRDPWPSPQNVATQGRVEIAGANLLSFLHKVRSYWIVSVSDAAPVETSATDSHTVDHPVHSPTTTNLCDDLKTVTISAVHNFNSIKGQLDSSNASSTSYQIRHGIKGFTGCLLFRYPDPTMQPSIECDGDADADADDLWTGIQVCFSDQPASHKVLKSGTEEFELDTTDNVAIRFTKYVSGRIDLWIDAPSTDQ
jgi:hypothetical protein